MKKELYNYLPLSNYSLAELQSYGEKKPTDLSYRIEVVRRLALVTNTQRYIAYDDIINAVPLDQRNLLHALPGYERHYLHTLLFALGFENGAVAIASAPPNPVEMAIIKRYKTGLEKKYGPIDYKIMFFDLFNQGEFINLLEVPEQVYEEVCEAYAKEMNNPRNQEIYRNEKFLTELVQRNFDKLSQGYETFVMPFIMTERHQNLSAYAQLPDIPLTDKALIKLKLLNSNPNCPYINSTVVVTPSGRLVTDLTEYLAYGQKRKEITSTEENVLRFAQAVIDAIDSFYRQGMNSYVKLDVEGVSGISNLKPSNYQQIYNPKISRDDRIKALKGIISSNFSNKLPTALVEEFVEPSLFEGVRRDATYGGIAINGVFFPLSVFPFATNNNDIYTHGWIASKPEDIGENPEEWERGFKIFEEMTRLLGVKTGIVAGDVFTTSDGRLIVHDWNLRRGGRSHPEAAVVFEGNGLFECQVELPVERRSDMDNLGLYQIYNAVCKNLLKSGIFPFSTAFGYFGNQDPNSSEVFLKFKLLVPINILSESPRNQHYGMVYERVERLVKKQINSLYPV